MISKKQAYIPMLVVAFATIMITGYISTSSLDNLTFASRKIIIMIIKVPILVKE